MKLRLTMVLVFKLIKRLVTLVLFLQHQHFKETLCKFRYRKRSKKIAAKIIISDFF